MRATLLLLLVGVKAQPWTTITDESECPNEWILIDGHCFKHFQQGQQARKEKYGTGVLNCASICKDRPQRDCKGRSCEAEAAYGTGSLACLTETNYDALAGTFVNVFVGQRAVAAMRSHEV